MAVNIHDAKTHLSKLLARVERGEEIVIARNGRPIAVLSQYRAPGSPRRPGTCRGAIRIADDFDSPDPAIEALFSGDAR
jgi:prevent-host-death family protein